MSRQRFTRREVLKAASRLGGLVLLSSPLLSCLGRDEPTPTPAPTPAPTPSPSPVPATSPVGTPVVAGARPAGTLSLVQTQDRAEGVAQALALLRTNLVRGKAVTLKPNFNTADPAPGSTHADTLRALVLAVWEMGASEVTLAERSGTGNTRQVMEQKGVFALANELDFEVVNLDEAGPDAWVLLRPPDAHWKDGFRFARIYLEAECVVQTCCLKTHAYGGHFSMSLKNAVGMVARTGYPYMTELHNSPHQRQMIAEINTAYSPALIVLDGVDAFVRGGPDVGERVNMGVILAGTDRVAVDAAGVALLRLQGTTPEVSAGPVFDQAQIARAVELGLGVRSPEEVAFVTDGPGDEALAASVREALLAS
jgi:uncharacterized protein (DUF362 family)